MGSVGCLAKGDIFFWQNILKNRSKYRGDISEQSVVCTVLISAIIIEIFRKKKKKISYIIPYKKIGQSAYTCMSQKVPHVTINGYASYHSTAVIGFTTDGTNFHGLFTSTYTTGISSASKRGDLWSV